MPLSFLLCASYYTWYIINTELEFNKEIYISHTLSYFLFKLEENVIEQLGDD